MDGGGDGKKNLFCSLKFSYARSRILARVLLAEVQKDAVNLQMEMVCVCVCVCAYAWERLLGFQHASQIWNK